jgi:hypothetical protein
LCLPGNHSATRTISLVLGSFKNRIILSASRDNWLLPFLFVSLFFFPLSWLLWLIRQTLNCQNLHRRSHTHARFLRWNNVWCTLCYKEWQNKGYQGSEFTACRVCFSASPNDDKKQPIPAKVKR